MRSLTIFSSTHLVAPFSPLLKISEIGVNINNIFSFNLFFTGILYAESAVPCDDPSKICLGKKGDCCRLSYLFYRWMAASCSRAPP